MYVRLPVFFVVFWSRTQTAMSVGFTLMKSACKKKPVAGVPLRPGFHDTEMHEQMPVSVVSASIVP